VVALPEPGPLRIGPVDLPTGKVLTSGLYGHGAPPREVAWVTLDPVPAAGRVWQQLYDLHHQTGLVPILLDTLGNQSRRPWDDEEFGDPVDLRAVDDVDVGDFLADWWHGSLPDEDELDDEEQEMWEPFGFTFPGLAPAGGEPLTGAEREEVLGSRPLARVGLVPARRPADVLSALGWSGTTNWGGLGGFRDYLIPLTAMLRSWEDRFGARPLEVGFDTLRLVVERPPRTRELAEHLAAEQFQLANDCIDGERGIPRIAPRLLNSPYWTFWWD
jgi:hypothetical protein